MTVVTAVVQGLTVSAGERTVWDIDAYDRYGCSCPRIWNDLQQKKRQRQRLFFGLTAGMAAMAVVMVGANLLITPMFMGVSKDVVWN